MAEPIVERPPRRAITVIASQNAWTCESCGDAGDFLLKGKAGGVCLDCADLGHLEFLPSGDAALTRRARKASRLSAVVVCWNTRRSPKQTLRADQDVRFRDEFAAAIREQFPGCPVDRAEAIALHAAARGSDLLMSGVDRESARAQVSKRVEDVVDEWREGVVMLDG
jgi:hypothetical protein